MTSTSLLSAVTADAIIVYATALVLVGGILARVWHVVRRASRLLDVVEEIPEWRKSVDAHRVEMADRMDEVENLSAAIARDLGVETRRHHRRPPRPAA